MRNPVLSDPLLRDIVDHRLETPTVEYKNWLPLDDGVARANTARHICALANAGGGYLVFGFEDDGSPAEPHPGDLSAYRQDAVNGIVERYLVPAPHCAVVEVEATTGLRYPVVRVPGHGAQPVCAKRDGPTENGRPAGIRSGVHYVRAPGPKTLPITTPELWRDVIHRCVMAERGGLLESFGRLMQQPAERQPADALGPWLDDAIRDWSGVTAPAWPVDLAANRVAFGFALLSEAGRPVMGPTLARLQEAIRSASFAAADEVNDGVVPFEMGWREGMRPTVAVFGEVEGYDYRANAGEGRDFPSLWRVGADGRGAEVSVLHEDSATLQEVVERRRSRHWPPGERLSPKFQIQHVAQRVAFVRNLAETFGGVADCQLVVDYAGLAGRVVDESAVGSYFSRQSTAAVPARRVATTATVEALGADLAGVTAALVGPVFRLFDGWDVGADYVRGVLGRVVI